MTILAIYKTAISAAQPAIYTEPSAIEHALQGIGVSYERLNIVDEQEVLQQSPEHVLSQLHDYIKGLEKKKEIHEFRLFNSNMAAEEAARRIADVSKEHSHSEGELCTMLAGRGLLSLHCNNAILQLLMQQNDTIAIPAKLPHWFQVGQKPQFVLLRGTYSENGILAHPTGSSLHSRYPSFDDMIAQHTVR